MPTRTPLEELYEAEALKRQGEFEEKLRGAEEAGGLGKRVSDVLLRLFGPFLWVLTTPIRWGIKWSVELLLDIIGEGLVEAQQKTLQMVLDQEGCPEELKQTIEKLREGGGEWTAMLGYSAAGAATGGLISSTIGAWLKLLEKRTLSYVRPGLLEPMVYISAYFRRQITLEELLFHMTEHGFPHHETERFIEVAKTYLDANGLTRYRWRFGMEEDEYLRRMEAIGWKTEDALEFYKVSHFYPAPADLIRWQAREVFEPEMIARYGLDEEYDRIEKEAFFKAGMTEEQIRNFWRAHWIHPSFDQVAEMLHRGLVTEEDMWDWFRVVEIPPYWRDRLIGISWRIPTRVDVRRWWDMGVVSEEKLRELYTKLGYHGEDLDLYVLWTRVYVAFPDLMARFVKGWLSESDVRAELAELGMPEERIDEMIETKIKNVQGDRVAKERDLTKAEIVKGVKKEVISYSEGVELLQDMGYDEDEAWYILAINLEALAGSPEGYLAFKGLTERYKRVLGKPGNPPPQELIDAERALKAAQARAKELEEAKAEDNIVALALTEVEEARWKYEQLEAAWRGQPPPG